MSGELFKVCGCECHTNPNVRHPVPCCAFTYEALDDAQEEVNNLLDKYGHTDNEYGRALRKDK